jgi:hypothetical protein
VKKKTFYQLFVFLFALAFFSGCVESLSDSSTSSSVTPTIEITSPVTGDSVNVGTNVVSYDAADGTGGSGISFYEVYLNGEYVERYDQNDDGTNPDITLTIDSDLLGKKIYYMIKVYNESNKSKESTVQENIYVRDSIPAAPTTLKLTRKSDYVVNLLWNASSIVNEDGFEVWRKDGGSGTYTRIKTLGANIISVDDSGISPFTDYYYKVCAYNESGRSEYSNEACTSSLDGGAWNLQAEAVGSSYIKLTWNDFAVNELGFMILRTYSSTTDTFTVSSGTTEYYDYDVSASTAYTYRVAYWTSSAVSGYSNSATVSTYSSDVDAPSDFVATYDDSTGLVTLSWTDNTTSEKSTIIERKTSSSGTYKEYITVDANDDETNTTTDSDITKGKTYYYRIRQKLGTNIYTSYSNVVTITIPE